MPHHLSHRKTLPHAEFQIVVSGISEASKCFPTIELLDEICQICLMYFTSSSCGQIKDAIRFSRRRDMIWLYY